MIGNDMLSPLCVAMIASFTIRYAFNFGKFLAKELRDRAIVEKHIPGIHIRNHHTTMLGCGNIRDTQS